MKLSLYVVLLLLALSFAHGFGMASSYLEDKTMLLAPGEVREYKIELQNNDPNAKKVKFDLISDIATIKNEQEFYLVGGDNIKETVTLVIKIPGNVQIGKEYSVKYSAVPTSDSGTPISLNIKFNNEFKVVVSEKELEVEEKKSNLGNFPVIIILIVVFLAAILLIFKKNRALIKRILKK